MANYKIWLSYDLGLGGDAEKKTDKQYQEKYQKRYTAITTWLKKYKALECGKSVALLNNITPESTDIKQEIIDELNKIGIKDEDGVRVYAMISDETSITYNGYRTAKPTQRILYAGFIIGDRQQAPWEEKEQKKYENIDIQF